MFKIIRRNIVFRKMRDDFLGPDEVKVRHGRILQAARATGTRLAASGGCISPDLVP